MPGLCVVYSSHFGIDFQGFGAAPVFRASAKGASGSEAECTGVFHFLNMIGADAHDCGGIHHTSVL